LDKLGISLRSAHTGGNPAVWVKVAHPCAATWLANTRWIPYSRATVPNPDDSAWHGLELTHWCCSAHSVFPVARHWRCHRHPGVHVRALTRRPTRRTWRAVGSSASCSCLPSRHEVSHDLGEELEALRHFLRGLRSEL